MAQYNLTFYSRGVVTVEADSEEEVRQKFAYMTDEELYENILDCDIIEVWKEEE